MRKKRKRTKINKSKVIILLSLVLMIIFGIYAFLNSGLFDVKNIKISGNYEIKKEYIIKKINIKSEKNIFTYDIKNMQSELMKNPYIEDVQIKRKLPNSLEIVLKEKEVIAILSNKETYCYIDREGKILEEIKEIETPSDKVIVDIDYNIKDNNELIFKDEEDKKRLLYLLKCLKNENVYKEISKVDFKNDEKIYITSKRDIEIVLPNNSKLGYNISRMSSIMVKMQSEKIKGGILDLTYADKAIYSPEQRMTTKE